MDFHNWNPPWPSPSHACTTPSFCSSLYCRIEQFGNFYTACNHWCKFYDYSSLSPFPSTRRCVLHKQSINFLVWGGPRDLPLLYCCLLHSHLRSSLPANQLAWANEIIVGNIARKRGSRIDFGLASRWNFNCTTPKLKRTTWRTTSHRSILWWLTHGAAFRKSLRDFVHKSANDEATQRGSEIRWKVASRKVNCGDPQ